MFKKKVIEIISNSLNEKIKILEKELKQINYEKNNQTKSSAGDKYETCLLYTSPSPRDKRQSRMPSSA